MNEFLRSKSMLTPGVAGGLTTLITATLSSQFNLPAKWTSLLISALLGLLIVWADEELSIPKKIPFFVLNSLIIFSMAVGTNTVGEAATARPKPAVALEREPQGGKPFFHDWLQE